MVKADVECRVAKSAAPSVVWLMVARAFANPVIPLAARVCCRPVKYDVKSSVICPLTTHAMRKSDKTILSRSSLQLTVRLMMRCGG